MDEILFFGDAVKALGGGKVGGYLVRFSTSADPDITQLRDFFTKDTDFDLERGNLATLYYDHGLDPVIKKRKLGRGTMKVDDVGVWIEAQLEMRDDYERAIYEMAQAGKLGWSSGTAPHLVERKQVGGANQIVSWPLGDDASLTPTPAEPRNGAVSLKFYREERAHKNVFEEAVQARSEQLAARARTICELTDTLQSMFYQLQWVALTADETGVTIDCAARIDEMLAGFVPAARAAGLAMCGVDTAASAETADAASSTKKSYGKLEVSLPLQTHSKAVRDAARGLIERLQSLHAQRSKREGTSRTLNEQHTENLSAIAGDLERAAKAARDLSSEVSAHDGVRRARVEFQRITARTLGVR
jgi:hypothetical protein